MEPRSSFLDVANMQAGSAIPLAQIYKHPRRRVAFPFDLALVLLAGCLLVLLPGRLSHATVTLRSRPRNLTDPQVARLLIRYNFFDRQRNPHGNFVNHFVAARYGSDRVVFDRATGLVWQQSGSQRYMHWDEARAYIHRLNRDRFAGYNKWRLPTVPELASLLEPRKLNGRLYLDPAFDSHQAWCWTSDQRGEGFAYLVSFYHGIVDWKFFCGRVFVRAVASASLFRAHHRKTAAPKVPPPTGATFTNSIGMTFVRIPAGSFIMGSPESVPGRNKDEGPQHRVVLTRPFYLGTTEVTQGQWRQVMGTNPSRFRGRDLPVENVSWNDCQEFIRRLNQREHTHRYRLPTEAEWEYACRAGSSTRFCFGDDIDPRAKKDPLRFYFGDEAGTLKEYAWYGNISANQTHPVAQKKPNRWGLFDMHGNVAEWCADWYGPYPAAEQVSPRGPAHGRRRILRGGGYGFGSWSVRSGRRHSQPPEMHSCQWGFRLACDAG